MYCINQAHIVQPTQVGSPKKRGCLGVARNSVPSLQLLTIVFRMI